MNQVLNLLTKTILFTLLCLVFSSNSKSKKTPESSVLQFNEGFNSRDFNKVIKVLHPKLKTIDYNGKIVSTNRDEYLNSGVYFTAVFDTFFCNEVCNFGIYEIERTL